VEPLIAGRALLLLNDVLQSQTADMKPIADEYCRKVDLWLARVLRLRRIPPYAATCFTMNVD
jgi:hypothetical protein